MPASGNPFNCCSFYFHYSKCCPLKLKYVYVLEEERAKIKLKTGENNCKMPLQSGSKSGVEGNHRDAQRRLAG